MKKAIAVLALMIIMSGCSVQENASASVTQDTASQTLLFKVADSETETTPEETAEITEAEPMEEADLPFRNSAAYKVYETENWASGSRYISVITYDEHDNEIIWEFYDENGECTYYRETAYEYDGEGNAIKEYKSADDYFVSEYENGKKTSWTHYENGEFDYGLTHEYYPNGDYKCAWTCFRGGEPHTMNFYEYEYDESDRMTVCREKSSEGELKNTEYYTYDEIGNKTESLLIKNAEYYEDLDESTAVIRYKWTYGDDGNVLTSVKTCETFDGAVTNEIVTEYKYDEQGRVISKEEHKNGEFNVLIEYTYEMIVSGE